MEFTENIQARVNFNPDDLTNKHRKQSSWKKHVIAFIDEPDLCSYHKWFIEKRFNLKLAEPIRGPHFTIVNDRLSDFPNSSEKKYRKVMDKWDGKLIDIRYEYAPYTDGVHWWLRARSEQATQIREEIGLSAKPYWGFHITIGRISGRDYEIQHGKYIHTLIKKGII